MTHSEGRTPEQSFGAQVREAREVRGWSQEGLARHLRDTAGIELHQTAIARLERGERAIRFNEVSALAKLLGLDLLPYSGTLPTLTADEYEHAVASLERAREQEEQLARELAALRERFEAEERELSQDRRALTENRWRLEVMIGQYEERQGG